MLGGKAANVCTRVALKAPASPQVKPPTFQHYSALEEHLNRFITSAKC